MMANRSAGIRIDAEPLRLVVLSVLMLLGLLYLVSSLFRIQVRDADLYSDAQDAYSFRRVRLPATRGRILDRNGVVLADNRPSYCVAFYIEELRKSGAWSNTVNQVDGLLDQVSGIVNMPREVDRDKIWAHVKRRRAIPLFAFKGLGEKGMARLAEWPDALPGTDIYVQSERVYPLGDVASHIIGYVGSGQPREAEEDENAVATDEDAEPEDFNYYLPDIAGREGIEYACDAALAGKGGGQLIRVNAVGYKHETIPGTPSVPGKDVVLTLDAELQMTAEKALGDKRGAAVVIDCRNGDILAMANSPRYNLQEFVPTLRSSTWNRLLKDPAKPLYNRSTSGIYPPGSVFKPILALCALREGAVTEHTTYTCTGSIMVGGRRIECSHRYGHGELDLRQAIAASCNPYFISVGMRLGFEPNLHDDCAMLGFGSAPRIGISTASGVLPSDAWKRKTQHDGWRGGDTANVSIGQGFFKVTPLQIALMTAAIATDGKVIKPRLIRDAGDGTGVKDQLEIAGTMNWSAQDLRVVKEGMYDVVNSAYGTGLKVAVSSVRAAGKTGTAEYMEDGIKKKHAWMILFAPYEKPLYAMAVVAEDSDFGGLTAAAISRQILLKLYPEPLSTNGVDSATTTVIPGLGEAPIFVEPSLSEETPPTPRTDENGGLTSTNDAASVSAVPTETDAPAFEEPVDTEGSEEEVTPSEEPEGDAPAVVPTPAPLPSLSADAPVSAETPPPAVSVPAPVHQATSTSELWETPTTPSED